MTGMDLLKFCFGDKITKIEPPINPKPTTPIFILYPYLRFSLKVLYSSVRLRYCNLLKLIIVESFFLSKCSCKDFAGNSSVIVGCFTIKPDKSINGTVFL